MYTNLTFTEQVCRGEESQQKWRGGKPPRFAHGSAGPRDDLALCVANLMLRWQQIEHKKHGSGNLLYNLLQLSLKKCEGLVNYLQSAQCISLTLSI